MAIKTFTDNTSLPASDINTYLTNSGLVYITETTLSISTQINNCFTSSMRNYRIIVNIDTHVGGAVNVFGRLSAGGTPSSAATYNFSGAEQAYSSPGVVTVGSAGATSWALGRLNGNTTAQFTFDITSPQATTRTFYKANYLDMAYSGMMGGVFDAATSFDGINIFLASGTSMSGKVFVYGYRNA